LHADEVFLTRNVVKSLAAARGMTATFLSKPVEGESGCGYHIHQTLTSRGETHSLFDASRFGETGSQRLGHFIAGQLQHLRDLSTLLLPTVNSYKRILTRGVQPLSLTWGEDNRTVALRVVSRNTAEARVENRVPAGECNPYLAIAASVAAGVQGILEAASAPPPTTGNAFQEGCDAPRLPGNLGEAVGLLRGSAMARQWFSEDLLSRFIALKQDEWERYLRSVTDWERQEYLAFL
jgi:glutamine synthetase